MPSEIATIAAVLTVIVGAAFSYGAYWAFTIRKALVSEIYRRQALWVGGVGLYFAAVSVFVAFIAASDITGSFLNLVAASFIVVGFIVCFDWVDSTIRVARRSDPLLRDTIHWSKLRYFIGIAGGVGLFFNIVFNVVFTSSFYSNPGSPPVVGYIGIVLFLGSIGLLLSGRRSGDMTLRRHLRWFGAGAILLWFSGQVGAPWAGVTNLPIVVPAVTYSLFGVAAYSLYKSAKSLVPLGHFSLTDSEATSISTSSTTSSRRP
jgi:hypothetical protein